MQCPESAGIGRRRRATNRRAVKEGSRVCFFFVYSSGAPQASQPGAPQASQPPSPSWHAPVASVAAFPGGGRDLGGSGRPRAQLCSWKPMICAGPARQAS